jgi:hypothetical protein
MLGLQIYCPFSSSSASYLLIDSRLQFLLQEQVTYSTRSNCRFLAKNCVKPPYWHNSACKATLVMTTTLRLVIVDSQMQTTKSTNSHRSMTSWEFKNPMQSNHGILCSHMTHLPKATHVIDSREFVEALNQVHTKKSTSVLWTWVLSVTQILFKVFDMIVVVDHKPTFSSSWNHDALGNLKLNYKTWYIASQDSIAKFAKPSPGEWPTSNLLKWSTW